MNPEITELLSRYKTRLSNIQVSPNPYYSTQEKERWDILGKIKELNKVLGIIKKVE